MSKARLVITAVVVEGRPQAEVARTYGVSKGWVSKLVARYRAEGDTAFEPRSRRPRSPNATDPATVELIVELRHELTAAGLDAGADTIGWHLEHHHQIVVSRPTIHRHLDELAGSSRNRRNDRSRRICVSKPNSPTSAGSPTSPTTASPTAPTPRSSPGSMTTPATRCGSPRISPSPRRSSSPSSAPRCRARKPPINIDR